MVRHKRLPRHEHCPYCNDQRKVRWKSPWEFFNSFPEDIAVPSAPLEKKVWPSPHSKHQTRQGHTPCYTDCPNYSSEWDAKKGTRILFCRIDTERYQPKNTKCVISRINKDWSSPITIELRQTKNEFRKDSGSPMALNNQKKLPDKVINALAVHRGLSGPNCKRFFWFTFQIEAVCRCTGNACENSIETTYDPFSKLIHPQELDRSPKEYQDIDIKLTKQVRGCRGVYHLWQIGRLFFRERRTEQKYLMENRRRIFFP